MIAFDIDGIILNTSGLMVEKYNELYGTDIKVEDWTIYEFEKCFNLPRENLLKAFREAVVDTQDSPIFYEGAVEALRTYKNHYKSITPLFITNRRQEYAEIAKRQIETAIDTEVIVDYKLNDLPVGKTERLKYFRVHIFYEDKPTYWKHYIDNGVNIRTFYRPYNTKEIEDLSTKCNFIKFNAYKDWNEVLEYYYEDAMTKSSEISRMYYG